MACYHPMYRYDVGLVDTNGNCKPIITSAPGVYHRVINKYGTYRLSNLFIDTIVQGQQIPCGHCIGCRVQRSSEWATRCLLEAQQYQYNECLTLTYDDVHLPTNTLINRETGECTFVGTLRHKDIQDFLKRVRKAYFSGLKDDKGNLLIKGHVGIRNFGCGEYGDKHQRPHYHVVLFNFPVFDKRPESRNKKQNMQYLSDTLTKLWGKGRVTLMPVNYETCAYIARYVLKKYYGPDAKEKYAELGIVPEYVFMSRRPGIAHAYFSQNGSSLLHGTKQLFVNTRNKLLRTKIPRYCDKLFEQDNEEEMHNIKKLRSLEQQEAERYRRLQTNVADYEYLANAEYSFRQKISKFKRKYESKDTV